MKKTAQNQTILKNTLLLSLFLGICFLRFTKIVLAQNVLGLSAVPPRLEITVEPGEYITKEIKVTNNSDTERVINTKIVDFIVVDQKGTPIEIDGKEMDNRWSASQWIQTSDPYFKLKPQETKAFTLTVIVPENARPGGHYAMVLHNPSNEVVLSETGSAIEANVGTLVYITVPGEIKQQASVDYMNRPPFSEYGPIDFETSISNLSDVHIKPIGSIEIKNWLGGKTAVLNYNENNNNIFPSTSHVFTNTLDKKWLFGRYQASLNATYGTNGIPLTAHVYFWVLPYKLIILIATTIILLILIIKLSHKKNNKQNKKIIDQLEEELEKLKNKYKD
jgi:hypothetical protein